VAIAPKRGDALMFHSLTPDLSKDFQSLHASCPTLRGDKWSATKWCAVRPPRRPGALRAPTAATAGCSHGSVAAACWLLTWT